MIQVFRPTPGCSALMIIALFLLSAPTIHAGIRMEVGGGIFTPFDNELRDAYDAGGAIQIGLSMSSPGSRAEIFLDGGYRKSSGSEYSDDPTFELPESEYSLIPIGFGVRGDLFPHQPGDRLSLLAGFTMQHVFSKWKGSFEDSEKTTVFGLAIELRPEYQLGDRWSVWVSQRFSTLGDAAYDSRAGELDYSSSTLMAGIAYEIRGDD